MSLFTRLLLSADHRDRRTRDHKPAHRRAILVLDRLEDRQLLSVVPGAWTQVAPLPAPRVYMGLTTGQNGNLYAVGGDIGGGGDYATTKVNVYSPKTNTWTPIAPLLT